MKIVTSLSFQGQCREAFEFYAQVLGGRITAALPFGQTFWSPGFGSLIDKFGIPWMINVVPGAGWKPAQG